MLPAKPTNGSQSKTDPDTHGSASAGPAVAPHAATVNPRARTSASLRISNPPYGWTRSVVVASFSCRLTPFDRFRCSRHEHGERTADGCAIPGHAVQQM